MHDDRRETGFTLLEVVIALVIAGLALTALFSGASTGLRSSQVSGDTLEALSLARSHLAEVGHTIPLLPGVRTGQDGRGFGWRLQIVALADAPFVKSGADDPAASQRAPRIVLLAVSVAETWPADGAMRKVQLATQRIGQMASKGP